MHPADIQAELKKRKITQIRIARELCVSPVHISEVIRKRRESNRVQQFVAEKIGRRPQEVFPEFYNKHPDISEAING